MNLPAQFAEPQIHSDTAPRERLVVCIRGQGNISHGQWWISDPFYKALLDNGARMTVLAERK